MQTAHPDATATIYGGNMAPGLVGTVNFFEATQGVLISAHIFGLPKENVTDFFAIHIHEGENCGGENFSETRGHYNPSSMSHPRHSGDLPPLLSNGGEAYMSVLTNRFKIDEIIGKTVVIHSDSDDFYSQPAGNPGIKIACGIIKEV